MKRKLIILILSAFVLLLTACDPGMVHYARNISIDDVVRVELIDYDNPKVKKISSLITERGIKAFDFKKMTIVEELSEEKYEDFFQDFSQLKLWGRWHHLNSPSGTSIRIVYSNDDFDVVSFGNIEDQVFSFMAKYNSKGKLIDFIGTVESKTDYINLINSYFKTQIPED